MSHAPHLLGRLLPGHGRSGHSHSAGSAEHGHGHDLGEDGFEGPAARRYDRWTGLLMRRPYRRIAADIAAGTPYGAHVLDVGAGPGHLLVQLARQRPDLRLTGADVSPDMAEIASGHLAEFGDRARAVTADVTDLPFPDGTFDLVVTSFSAHHWPDVAAGVAEIGRVLRPDGHLGVYDFQKGTFDETARAAANTPTLAGRTERRGRVPRMTPPLRRLIVRQVF